MDGILNTWFYSQRPDNVYQPQPKSLEILCVASNNLCTAITKIFVKDQRKLFENTLKTHRTINVGDKFKEQNKVQEYHN